MKTITIDSVKHSLTFKVSTGMYTTLVSPAGKIGQFGADIYESNKPDILILVATTPGSGGSRKSATTISISDYQKIADLHDAYDGMPYHRAIMFRLGFE